MKVDYIAIMQKYCSSDNDSFITDLPRPIQLSDQERSPLCANVHLTCMQA
jgi:hypothetical protein